MGSNWQFSLKRNYDLTSILSIICNSWPKINRE